MNKTKNEDWPLLMEWLAYKAKCWQAAGHTDATVEGLEDWLKYKCQKLERGDFSELVGEIILLTPNSWHDYVALSFQVLDVPRLEDMDLSQLLS
ncbi:hypothetical protein [Atopobacter sp. AH10]|uniref:hypothetical protein n=1 Tax=Atopobacter sp. AH10 TaxID=2315861 RepID=UPI000EF2488F|nr:hypothetical protein [Atopobacter sp. AH10]